MLEKRLGAEQIVMRLRQVEVLQSHGKSIAVACMEAGLTEQSYWRHRKEYGGLNVDQARKLTQLALENGRLKKLKPAEDDLTRNIVLTASTYVRYGYRRVTAMLDVCGMDLGKDRVERRALIRDRSEDQGERRREGLRVPQKQPKRSRLWLNDGS